MGVHELIQNEDGHANLHQLRNLTEVFIIPNKTTEYSILECEDKENSAYLFGLNESRTHLIAYNLLNGQVTWRLKPDFAIYREHALEMAANQKQTGQAQALSEHPILVHETSLQTANYTVEKFLVSQNGSLMVVSYGIHQACVFLLSQMKHVGNLDEAYANSSKVRSSKSNALNHNAPNLSISVLSSEGFWLAHSEFNESKRSTCLTIWSLAKFHACTPVTNPQISWRRKYLPDQSDLVQIAISDHGCRVVAARQGYGVLVWDPCSNDNDQAVQKLRQSERLEFSSQQPPLLNISKDGTRILVASGRGRGQLSVWQIDDDHNNNSSGNKLIGHIYGLNLVQGLDFSLNSEFVALNTYQSGKPLFIWPKWNT